jgi:ATP-binding protein involved in chromosome partitioning
MSDTAVFNDNDVRTALHAIQAPCMSIDPIAANMLRDVRIDGSDVHLTLAMPVPSRRLASAFTSEIETALRKHLPAVGAVHVDLSDDIPSQQSAQLVQILPGVKNTIAVASGKGGVGKSTVAVNLAVALAQNGARVGLVDADIYGPSIPLMFGVNEQPSAYVENGKTRLLPIENHGVKVMSIGFLIDPDTAVVWRGPMASGALKQFLTDVDWGQLDYLLFDMPPGTGDIQLTLSQMLPLTGSVIVTTPQDISLADARKGVRMFEKVSVPILGIIENMSFHVCSNCGHRDEIFSYGGGREAALELGVPFLGEIPIERRIREGGDKGVPIVVLEPSGAVAQCFHDTALTLAGRISQSVITSGGAPRIDISL